MTTPLHRSVAARRTARAMARGAGRLTSGARTTPDVLIVGGQRCGTTSLFKTLRQHPAVLPPVLHKGVHYFDTGYPRGMGWYRAHFPLRATAARVQRRTGVRPITVESSPYYMFHPLAAERIDRDLPGVKVLVLLRDPVERAYSAHAHELARGFETEDFRTALDLEEERLDGEVERLLADPGYRSHSTTPTCSAAATPSTSSGWRASSGATACTSWTATASSATRSRSTTASWRSSACRTPATPPSSGTTRAPARRCPTTCAPGSRRTSRRTTSGSRPGWAGRSAGGSVTSPSAELPAPPAAPDGGAPGPSGLSGLARGGLLSLSGSAVSAAVGILLVLVVTRTLPQDTAGTFFALTSVFLIAEGVTRLGTGTGLVWAVSRSRALGTADLVPAFLRVALTPVSVLGVALGVALFAGADALAGLVGGPPGGGISDAVRVLAVLLPLSALSDSLVAATRGYGTVLPTVLLDRLGRPLLQLGAVALVAATGSLALLATAWAVPWVLTALAAAWWLRRLQPRAAAGRAAGPRPWADFWRFTGPRAVTSVVQLALQRLDIVLLTLLAGPAEAAVYTAATRFLVVGQVAGQALASVAEPRLGALLAVRDRVSAGTEYRTATGWLVLVCWPFYLLVATYAGTLLGWFGDGYDAGVTVVLVLAGAMLFATVVGTVDVVLIMGGRTSWNLANSCVALAVNVAVDLVLIPPLGLLGAAIGWAAAICVNNLLPLLQVWRHLGLHPFGAGTGTAVALATGCFAVLPVLAGAVWDGGLPADLATTVLGAALFLLGCRRWNRVLALDALRTARRGRRPAAPPSTPEP